jgi:nicotinamide-nucleotide amidase
VTTAAICSVGDELLAGEVVDTNAAWLAGRLLALGIEVRTTQAVGDDLGRLVAVLRRLVAEHDVVLVGGGLGPTSDDRTREAVAAALGLDLEHREDLAEAIAARFRSFDAVMPATNLRQAEVPVGSTALDPVGTAPGFVVRGDDTLVAALPGVPWEIRAMFDQLEEHLVALPGIRPSVTRALTVVGMGESAVAETLAGLEDVLPDGVAIAYLASGGQIRVKLTARGDDREQAAAVLEPLLARARDLLGDAVAAVDAASLEQVVVQQLAARGRTLAVAESATGGRVTARLTSVPGASRVLLGGVVVYTAAAKTTLAGVDQRLLDVHGPVSAEVTEALAEGVRARLGADVGVATTGVAGPDPQGGREVGTMVWAVATGAGVRSWERRLTGDRATVQERLTTAALEAVRRTP